MRGFTTRFVNPIMRRVAGVLPGFAILTYRGRRSGRTYRTPMNAFRIGDHYVFALTYGADVDWVKNVFAAGGCTMRTRRRDVRLVEPELIHDPGLRLLPWLPRTIERINGVEELIRMRVAPGAPVPD